MPTRKNAKERIELRRATASELKQARDARTPAQQLEVLDNRLGAGVGAVKERERLQHLIDNPPSKKNKKDLKNNRRKGKKDASQERH
jgi:hypothetical protein